MDNMEQMDKLKVLQELMDEMSKGDAERLPRKKPMIMVEQMEDELEEGKEKLPNEIDDTPNSGE